MDKKEKTQLIPEIKKRVSGKKSGAGANFGNIRELPHPAAVLFGLTQDFDEQQSTDTSAVSVKTTDIDCSEITSPISGAMTRQSTVPSHSTGQAEINKKNYTESLEIAPTNNFQKVPNSITKIAIPAGVFRQGKSKQLYDVLYSLTRGAIDPKRSIRISKKEIMRLAGIGSRITFDTGIIHLESVGLLKQTIFAGEQAGNEFEILLYEEALTLPSQTSLTSLTSHAQKLVRLVRLETSQTRQSTSVANKGSCEIPKTSLKTKTDDDEKKTLSHFREVFESVSLELTGEGLQAKEKIKWKALAELLADELRMAALKTDSVSSVPGFLTEHLRRRLWQSGKKPQKSRKESHTKDMIGKPDSDSEALEAVSSTFNPQDEYFPEPLTERQREAVLASMKEFIKQNKKDFVMSLKNTYTEEDWDWLMSRI